MGEESGVASGGPGRRAQPLLFTRILLIVVMGGLVVSSGFCLVSGLLPPEAVKARLDALAPDGSASGFPLPRIAAMQRKSLAAFAICILIVGALWRFRGALDQGCRQAGATLREARVWAGVELRARWAVLAAITAAALVLRAAYLGQPMRVDESVTYLEFVSKPLIYGIAYYPAPNNHILHTVLAHVATALFGGEPWAIRLTALLAGTLMVPAAALAAVALQGRAAALPAAALVAVSWPWVFYSANARGYTLFGLLFLLMIPLCVKLRKQADAGAWIWFAILAALWLYTIPVALYALAPLALWVLAGRAAAWREAGPALLGAGALTLVLYAPALTASGFAAAITPEMQPLARADALRGIPQFALRLWSHWGQDVPGWLWTALCAAAAAGWRSAGLASISAAWLAAALFIYPAMPYTRVWLWLSLPWLLLVACGLGRLGGRTRWAGAVLLALVCWQGLRIHASQSIPRSVETGAFREAAKAADYLRTHWRTGDRLTSDLELPPLIYELQRRGLVYAPRASGRLWAVSKEPPRNTAEMLHDLGSRKIFLIHSPGAAAAYGWPNSWARGISSRYTSSGTWVPQ